MTLKELEDFKKRGEWSPDKSTLGTYATYYGMLKIGLTRKQINECFKIMTEYINDFVKNHEKRRNK